MTEPLTREEGSRHLCRPGRQRVLLEPRTHMAGRLPRQGFWQTFGPGLIWAAAAIGVSHLVQSTRAGAVHAFGLAWIVILANLLKYPFFEFGPRYAAATGESLVEGYRRQGRGVVLTYLVLTLATMFTVEAAVTFVGGAIATQLFGEALSPFGYSVVLLGVCALLLIPGRYPLLDRSVKVIMAVLTVSTIAAVVGALLGRTGQSVSLRPVLPTSGAEFAFLIALVGWMPSAIDISVWHSLWTLARAEQTGHRPTLREALTDFNIGYIGTAVMALFFVALGALIWAGSGSDVPTAGGAFAAQLIALYTDALGPWARPVIAIAAFTTMFSTTLTVTDAFPRVLQRTTAILWPESATNGREQRLYWIWMIVLIGGAILLMGAFRGQMTTMVDVATTLSFVTAPVLSWFNLRAVRGPWMPDTARPRGWRLVLAWAGLGFATLFALGYVGMRVVAW
jgi:Mn2+/Fe2+ NRAMP family transporter